MGRKKVGILFQISSRETLAADFDARHPQLAAILRELGVALARVGI